jgi:N-acylneuraminate cytidylyltransferase
LSGKITAYELPPYTAYEIDEPTDWIIVEELMKKIN